jgi:hypothetical protein
MRKTYIVMAMTATLLFSTMGIAFGEVNPTPSTNEINETNDWSHFEVLETRVGEVDVKFENPRGFVACFEYRSDDEGPDYGDGNTDNFNPAIEDGLWDFVCVGTTPSGFSYGNPRTVTLSALEYVEIRMVFGAEADERFDWTRVEVLPPPPPGYHGLQKAASTPAGERANDNARFKNGNPNAKFNRNGS